MKRCGLFSRVTPLNLRLGEERFTERPSACFENVEIVLHVFQILTQLADLLTPFADVGVQFFECGFSHRLRDGV